MPTSPQQQVRIQRSREMPAYLHDLLGEMAQMARRSGQPFLAYLIGMAAAEAARAARGR